MARRSNTIFKISGGSRLKGELRRGPRAVLDVEVRDLRLRPKIGRCGAIRIDPWLVHLPRADQPGRYYRGHM